MGTWPGSIFSIFLDYFFTFGLAMGLLALAFFSFWGLVVSSYFLSIFEPVSTLVEPIIYLSANLHNLKQNQIHLIHFAREISNFITLHIYPANQ